VNLISPEKLSNNVVGYAAYFELMNGFSKALYMSTEQIKAHGKKFSKTYDFAGASWKQNFEAMARKTVLKLLLSRYAPLSVEMQSAIQQDQAEIQVNDEMEMIDFSYVDGTGADTDNAMPDKADISKEVKANRRTQAPKDDAIDVPLDLQ